MQNTRFYDHQFFNWSLKDSKNIIFRKIKSLKIDLYNLSLCLQLLESFRSSFVILPDIHITKMLKNRFFNFSMSHFFLRNTISVHVLKKFSMKT